VNGGLQVLRLEIQNDAAAFAVRVTELASLEVTVATADPNLLARAAVAADFERQDAWSAASPQEPEDPGAVSGSMPYTSAPMDRWGGVA
jgi:hypothetical protein